MEATFEILNGWDVICKFFCTWWHMAHISPIYEPYGDPMPCMPYCAEKFKNNILTNKNLKCCLHNIFQIFLLGKCSIAQILGRYLQIFLSVRAISEISVQNINLLAKLQITPYSDFSHDVWLRCAYPAMAFQKIINVSKHYHASYCESPTIALVIFPKYLLRENTIMH